MHIIPYPPFRQLARVEDQFEKLFDKSFSGNLWLDLPGVDMYEENGQLIVETNLPDYAEEDIQVTATGQTLEIKAEHKSETEKKHRKYITKQRSDRSYLRVIGLPEGAKADEAEASFEGGILKISMPTTKLPEPKKIAITAKAEP